MSWKSSLIVCGFLFALASWSNDHISSTESPEQQTKNDFALLLLSVSLGVGTND